MSWRWLIVLCTLTVAAVCAAENLPSTAESTASLYRIENGHVIFPNWDRQTSITEALLTVEPQDFPGGVVYRERLLVGDDKGAISKPFKVPQKATTFTVTARSLPTGDIFPRLRISLATPDNNLHRLFDGYWQTRSLETYEWPLNEYLRGREVQLVVEFLNPGVIQEQRTWYFLRANIY